jgi:hypothetical protein
MSSWLILLIFVGVAVVAIKPRASPDPAVPALRPKGRHVPEGAVDGVPMSPYRCGVCQQSCSW